MNMSGGLLEWDGGEDKAQAHTHLSSFHQKRVAGRSIKDIPDSCGFVFPVYMCVKLLSLTEWAGAIQVCAPRQQFWLKDMMTLPTTNNPMTATCTALSVARPKPPLITLYTTASTTINATTNNTATAAANTNTTNTTTNNPNICWTAGLFPPSSLYLTLYS